MSKKRRDGIRRIRREKNLDRMARGSTASDKAVGIVQAEGYSGISRAENDWLTDTFDLVD